MNPKKKPEYDAGKILQNLMVAAMEMYTEKKSLREIADALSLNPIKVRKLLITAGVYESDVADEVNRLRKKGRTVGEIMHATGLSKASVNSYLPYTKVPYKAGEVSANADRVKKYQERKVACEKLKEEGGMDNLWNCIVVFEGYPFYTADGVRFRYVVKGSEMKINDRIVAKDTVDRTYQKTAAGEKIDSDDYLYPVFVRFGIV
ncbi:MAG: glycosyltransferase family 69 protein [Clostridiales bacterium]|nr:glycosyltransferase family 69 protein [Clostridiales bacterium]